MISRRGVVQGLVAGAVSALPLARAFAQSAAPACAIVPKFTHFEHDLPHSAHQLIKDKTFHMIAVGSSSTAGARASAPDKTYPSVLCDALAGIFPDKQITMKNCGENGAVISGMMATFEKSAAVQKPHLVLLQACTNTVLKDQPLEPAIACIGQAVQNILARDMDVILINSQKAPLVDEKEASKKMHEALLNIGALYGVNVFDRYGLMSDWVETQRLKPKQILHSDDLHLIDWSYACWARNMAHAIATTAVRTPREAPGMASFGL